MATVMINTESLETETLSGVIDVKINIQNYPMSEASSPLLF